MTTRRGRVVTPGAAGDPGASRGALGSDPPFTVVPSTARDLLGVSRATRGEMVSRAQEGSVAAH